MNKELHKKFKMPERQTCFCNRVSSLGFIFPAGLSLTSDVLQIKHRCENLWPHPMRTNCQIASFFIKILSRKKTTELCFPFNKINMFTMWGCVFVRGNVKWQRLGLLILHYFMFVYFFIWTMTPVCPAFLPL